MNKQDLNRENESMFWYIMDGFTHPILLEGQELDLETMKILKQEATRRFEDWKADRDDRDPRT